MENTEPFERFPALTRQAFFDPEIQA